MPADDNHDDEEDTGDGDGDEEHNEGRHTGEGSRNCYPILRFVSAPGTPKQVRICHVLVKRKCSGGKVGYRTLAPPDISPH